MSGLVLRLAGPLQAWGEHSVFHDRDTVRFPTRSGLIGLFAAAEGRGRDADLDRYAPLGFTVRIDRPGVMIEDFHTVGGGYARHRTVITAEGKRRSSGTATIVTRRRYLSDAVFCVAVTGPAVLTGPIAAALRSPRWQPYLGRRSCLPDQPLLLRSGVTDPEHDLRTRVPLARFRGRGDNGEVSVGFVVENTRDGAATVTELADVPESFARLDRRYRTRAVAVAPDTLPASLCAGHGRTYLTALHAYTQEG